MLTTERVIFFHVDDDGGSADDEIGSAVLHLHHQSADEPWSVDGRWLALRNSKHKPCGEVKIAVEWIAEPPAERRRRMTVTVMEGSDLPERSNVYCKVQVGEDTQRSQAVVGGKTSAWGYGEEGEEMTFSMVASWVPSVSVALLAEGALSDEHIAARGWEPDHTTADADEDWTKEETLALRDKQGKPCGSLRILLRWEALLDAADAEDRALTVTLFNAQLLLPRAAAAGRRVPAPDAWRAERLYCAVSMHGLSQRTSAATASREGLAEWGDARSGHEQLAFLRDAAGGRAAPAADADADDADADDADALALLWDFALHFNISPRDEPHLLWVAEEAARCGLPRGWEELEQQPSGNRYYHHSALGRTQWEHPLDPYLRAAVAEARAAAAALPVLGSLV